MSRSPSLQQRLVTAADVPQDHAALLALLSAKPDAYRGKNTAYDLKVGGRISFVTRTSNISRQAWTCSGPFGSGE